MTDSDGQQPMAVDPIASNRADLLVRISAAQFAIEGAIAALSRIDGDPSALAAAQLQSQALAGLSLQIATADARALPGMRAEIMAAIAATSSVAQQASTSPAVAALPDAEARRAAARQTIQSVAHDIFERKVFDPYLEFASAKDEEEYRKRERERDALVLDQLAKGTPEGTRLATDATIAQIEDAGAHGADRSPGFAAKLAAARNARDVLREQQPNSPDMQVEHSSPPEQTATDSTELDEIAAVLQSSGVAHSYTSSGSQGHGLANRAMVAKSDQKDVTVRS
jgi:hypothetical protein